MKKNMFLLLCVLILPRTALGEIILTVSDATIDAGGSGFADVFIRSTATDNISSYDIGFSITDVGSPVGVLQFANPQTDVESSQSNYLFHGASGGVLATVGAPASMSQSDFQSGFSNVAVSATDFLLARIELEHVLPGGTSPFAANGDQFTLSITSTMFFDDVLDPVLVNTTHAGLITAAAVPEPSHALLLAAGFAWPLFRRYRRRCVGEDR